jgi:hypothetical protein
MATRGLGVDGISFTVHPCSQARAFLVTADHVGVVDEKQVAPAPQKQAP